MGVLSENAIIGASAAGGYDIDYSCRYNVGDSPILKRDVTVAGNRRTSTWSAWVKIGWNTFSRDDTTIEPLYTLFCCGNSDGRWNVGFANATATNNNLPQLMIAQRDSGGSQAFEVSSNQAFRDPSAWYHIVVVMDTTQATNTNRVKAYINGERITDWGVTSWPSQNYDSDCFRTADPTVRVRVGNTTNQSNVGAKFWDGYISEVHVVDGQALLPSDFGETDVLTNEWKAIKYAGTYGTNGFYLDFSNSGALGADTSGNGNNLTVSGLAATDQMIDTPQNSTGGNFPTWSPLCYSPNSNFYEGNLKHYGNAAASGNTVCNFTPPATGKWYWEEHCSNIDSTQWPFIGTVDSTVYEKVGTWSNNDGRPGESESNGGWKISADGEYETDGGGTTAGGVSFNDTTDIIQFALDHDNGALYYGKNNVWYTPTATTGDPTSGASRTGAVMTWTAGARSFIPAAQQYNSSALILNCGQDSSFAGNVTAQGNSDGNDCGDFYYTPPAGYLALCSDNLADPSITLPTDHFNSILWTGDGTSPRSFTGVGFTPDFTWTKNCTTGVSHQLYDTIRGAGNDKELASDSASAEGGGNAETYGYLSAFGSDGFTTTDGSGSPNYYFNENTKNFVSWNWKAGGAGAANTSGSIDSTVSANTTAGFSIVTYTGEDNAGDTVGHGLSQAPELILIKDLTTAEDWQGYDANGGATKYIQLNDTGPYATDTTRWNDTAPTATVFSLGTSDKVNDAGDNYVAYCWHSVEGYSKVGSYTGNSNTNGPFIYTGFRPAFIMVKLTSAASGYWVMFDNKRDPDNPTDRVLYANITAISTDVSSYSPYDLLSNGFKSRIPGGNGNEASYNSNNQTYIYLAFAESPFKTSRAR